jgi:hypothetical protein
VKTSKKISDRKEEASDLEQQVVAAKTQESARERERERDAQNGVTITELEQPTLDGHTAWYLYPQARARAIPAYYNYGPSTNGQCEHGH